MPNHLCKKNILVYRDKYLSESTENYINKLILIRNYYLF